MPRLFTVSQPQDFLSAHDDGYRKEVDMTDPEYAAWKKIMIATFAKDGVNEDNIEKTNVKKLYFDNGYPQFSIPSDVSVETIQIIAKKLGNGIVSEGPSIDLDPDKKRMRM